MPVCATGIDAFSCSSSVRAGRSGANACIGFIRKKAWLCDVSDPGAMSQRCIVLSEVPLGAR